MVNIRPLRETDQGEWLRLRHALWPEHPFDDLKQQTLDLWADRDQQPVFVVERPDGGLGGFVEVAIHENAPGCTTDRIGYLEAWYVDADLRSQGLGKRLVETAEAWARSVGCREMASDTTLDYPASPLAHTALGYQIVEWYFRKDLMSSMSHD